MHIDLEFEAATTEHLEVHIPNETLHEVTERKEYYSI